MGEHSKAIDDKKSRPKPRRFVQWGLRSLFLVVTLFALGLGGWHIFVRPYQLQADIRHAIKGAGGSYTAQPSPAWLQWIIGEDTCQDVTEVNLAREVSHQEHGFGLGSLPLMFDGPRGLSKPGASRVASPTRTVCYNATCND